jgi:hypothetical protein
MEDGVNAEAIGLHKSSRETNESRVFVMAAIFLFLFECYLDYLKFTKQHDIVIGASRRVLAH